MLRPAVWRGRQQSDSLDDVPFSFLNGGEPRSSPNDSGIAIFKFAMRSEGPFQQSYTACIETQSHYM